VRDGGVPNRERKRSRLVAQKPVLGIPAGLAMLVSATSRNSASERTGGSPLSTAAGREER
jgi:hypothetical protein